MSDVIECEEIETLIPHRFPFLLVDRCFDYVEGQSIRAIKCVSANEPFFQGHFPGRPLMPGVLQIEAMAQASAVLMSKSLKVDPAISGIMYHDPAYSNTYGYDKWYGRSSTTIGALARPSAVISIRQIRPYR